MAAHLVKCLYCNAEATLSQTGRYCSPKHRTYHHRQRLAVRRANLASEASAALRSGDISALERVAHRTAELLTPAQSSS